MQVIPTLIDEQFFTTMAFHNGRDSGWVNQGMLSTCSGTLAPLSPKCKVTPATVIAYISIAEVLCLQPG